jgi:hypothetical protein
MSQRASNSLVQILIRVGLLLVLGIMLMAENAMAMTPAAPVPAGLASPSAAGATLAR